MNPVTRPKSWWRYDAPPPGIRARVGGVGTASHEYWGRQPDGWLGIPIGWMTAEDLRRQPPKQRLDTRLRGRATQPPGRLRLREAR